MAVEFRVLGAIEVCVDGRPADIGHVRQQCVLVALLVEAERAVPIDQLVHRVWGDHPPQRVRSTLHSYLSRLRQVLAPVPEAVIERRAGGYVLAVDPMTVDLHRFRDLVTRARAAGRDEPGVSLLTDALGLWRGEAFATLDTPWLNSVREGLDAERLAAELDRNDLLLGIGRHADLLAGLSAAAAAHPWDERLAGQLMLALYRCGRQAAALDLYQRLRLRLADELGADPSPPLRRLHQQVLTADPALDAPEAATAVSAGVPPAGRRLPLPRQLPASPSTFTGRAAELARLDEIMTASAGRGATVVISAIGGSGGIGKTWLALRWAHDNAHRFPDGQLYVNLRGFDPTTDPVAPAVALRGFLDTLGVAPADIPADTDAQAALYRSLIAHRRILIVLDNARDTATVTPLLPGTSAGAVLVTSRHQLGGLVTTHGARPLALDVLPDADARDLLLRHLGRQRAASDERSVAELVRQCAGLPLALGIIAARAALQPGLSLAALAGELRAAGTRLDALDAGELAVNLRAVLSCSYRALTPEAARLFALLGHTHGPDLSLAAAASLAGTPIGATRSVLHQLTAAHLVHEHVPGRYRMHDLVRLHAVELAAGAEPGREALHRLLDHYLHTAYRAALLLSPHRDPLTLTAARPGTVPTDLADLDAAMLWFTTEHPVLLATIVHAGAAGFDVHACQLPWTLATFFDRRGHWHDWVTAQHEGLEAARRLGARADQAQAHRLLANAYSNLRRYEDAHGHLGCALTLFGELGDDAGRAHVHLDIAMLFDRQGLPREALPHAHRTLELYRAVGTPLKQAVALNAVGWYHSQLGEHREALGYGEEALALSQQAGSPYGQANTWDSLGFAHHHLGEHRQAIACYRQALDLFRDIGDRHAEALVRDHLGDTHHAVGDAATAREEWRQALDTLERLGHPAAGELRAKLR
ncbi:AfsR/SARP family transcriptional regulator [Actinoplanes flavus]|uniref:Tetratricopeptide repeat protein n=1 Tax=Actinoplanes flavus TaxID=2820290 RepID=A0ABS3UWR7_9ACTN|nr:BTAD domain-containing putative transcriptional regulator [Actinoplanes flavus]MBO3743033.1 tetratricopeptide repeat protein [Actinoplanes flavus]